MNIIAPGKIVCGNCVNFSVMDIQAPLAGGCFNGGTVRDVHVYQQCSKFADRKILKLAEHARKGLKNV